MINFRIRYANIVRHILIIFLSCIVSNGYAQLSVSIVLEGGDKKPIESGSVFLASSDTIILKSGYTDSIGVVTFENISAGTYFLRIRCAEYADTMIGFSFNENIVGWTISMKGLELELDGVEVIYETPLIETKGNLIIVNIDKTILKGSGSVYDLLGKLPGMSYDAQGTLMFRGRAGINVRLDGRDLRLSGSGLSNYLYSLSSDDVEKVEILHTPDATEDAEGSSAILNIVTLKGKKLGFNGTLTAGLTYGRTFRGNVGVNLNYRPSVRLNVYGNYSFGPGNFVSSYENDRTISSTGIRIEERINSDYNWIGHTAKIGLDYTLNSKSYIGFALSTNLSNKETSSLSTIENFITNQADTLIKFSGLTYDQQDEFSGNIFYSTKLDSLGSELEINADFVRFNNASTSNLTADYSLLGVDLLEDLRQNINPSIVTIGSLKLDAAKQLKKSILYFGAKSSIAHTDNDFQASIGTSGAFENDTTRSNHFLFDEFIVAAYAQYSFELKSLELTLGLRPEYSTLRGNSLTLDTVFSRSVLALFPSFSIGKQMGKKNRVDLSYSRRLNRPNYADLNPFEIYLTNYSYWKGNPDLLPQFSHNFSFSHSFNYKIWTTLSYSYTTNMFMPTIFQDDISKRFFTVNTNFGASHFGGLFVYTSHKLADWWNLTNNGGVFYSEIMDTRNEASTVLVFAGIKGYYLNSTSTFTLPAKFQIELALRYNGPGKGLWESNDNFSIDFGVSKRFKNSAMISLQCTNILNTISYVNVYNYENVNYQSNYIPELRTIRLSLSYPFGKQTVDSAAKRESGAEDEKNRVKK